MSATTFSKSEQGQRVAAVEGGRVFHCDGLRVEMATGIELADRQAQLRHLIDPGTAVRSLHWGRNYLYLSHLTTADGTWQVVVKQFHHDTLKARLRRRTRGSKAERSWRVARTLLANGFATPEPILLADSVRIDGPSYYVSRYLPQALEARYLIRALNAGRAAELFPEIDADRFIRQLALLARRLHDADIWYRDLSSGNVLLDRRETPSSGVPPLVLVDCNRARTGKRLSRSERMRDLSRLSLQRYRDRHVLLAAYEESAGNPASRLAVPFLYGLYHHGFLLKNRSKRSVRGALRRVGDLMLPRRRGHAHLPPPDRESAVRDRAVWDRLSDQPHQHAGRLDKLRVRLADAPSHLHATGVALGALLPAWRRYRELRQALYTQPVPWGGVGVGLAPQTGAPEAVLDAIAALGVKTILLRAHPWETSHDAAAEQARELARRGIELVLAIPQNRDLVRDPERWRSAVTCLAGRFAPHARHFQIGQAVNRSKWGIWNAGEYVALYEQAAEILRRERPDAVLLGPAVIDFEAHATAHLLNIASTRLRYDIVSSLLYVDRRGAPENRQFGLDTVGKLCIVKALAETSRNAPSGRSWVTEVNWPLREGPHSPAGRDVAVGEEEQADYLVRYYLLGLGSGLVERIYWWQLVAKGYGLLDPGCKELRRRPSFRAMATLRSTLEGGVMTGPLPAPAGTHLHPFVFADGRTVVVGWSSGSVWQEATLPRPWVAAHTRGGESLGGLPARRVQLGPSPRYFELAPE